MKKNKRTRPRFGSCKVCGTRFERTTTTEGQRREHCSRACANRVRPITHIATNLEKRMSASTNVHTNEKPRPSPRELWMQAEGDRVRFQALMREHGWVEWDEGAGRLERVPMCTKTAWCFEPAGHEGGCIIRNESRANPGAVVDATNSKNPNGAGG